MMQQQLNEKPCKYFIWGKCKFGPKCRYSHDVLNAFVMRHAQSAYNEIVDQYQYDAFSEQAKLQYQMDPQLIDCPLTETGVEQVKNLNHIPDIMGKTKSGGIDLVFVSPLERALRTAHIFLNEHKIQPNKVIVLPQLTEVLSKICDFSGGVAEKKIKYPKFDFTRLQILSQKGSWQDRLIDDCFQQGIDHSLTNGKQYMKILDEIFPTPLECSHRCFQRTMEVIQEIKKISKEEKAQKVLIVSHNRVLKYIVGRFTAGKAQSLLNCEIRHVIL